MIVVRRPFRNLGKVLTVGTVISDPTVIKHFKSRFAEGKLVEVNEHNFESYYNFFKKKYGVDLPKLQSKEVEVAKETEAVKEAKVTSNDSVKVVAAVVK